MNKKILTDINKMLDANNLTDLERNKLYKFLLLIKKNIIDNNKIEIKDDGKICVVMLKEGKLEYQYIPTLKYIRAYIMRLEVVVY